MRLLLAEDDPGLNSIIAQGLRESGYIVDSVLDGMTAIERLKFYDYDVAIIDWRMPGTPGIDVVRWCRTEERPVGIIMLTARDATTDRIEGLDAGADDYLVKPFDFEELLARIRAVQRRPRSVEGPELTCGDVTLDPVAHKVSVSGTTINLTGTEYLILELLMRRMPQAVTRETIAQHAWKDETEPLGSNAIDVQISRLRAKFPSARMHIITVRGVGYRLESA
ncbi:MAG: response regulator transcription factor [Candidatus Dormibacteria bacterium]